MDNICSSLRNESCRRSREFASCEVAQTWSSGETKNLLKFTFHGDSLLVNKYQQLDIFILSTKKQSSVLFERFIAIFVRVINSTTDVSLKASAEKLAQSLAGLSKIVASRPDLVQSYGGRDFAFSLANIYIGGLLLDHAMASGNRQDFVTARHWMLRDLSPIVTLAQQNGYDFSKSEITDFVYEGF